MKTLREALAGVNKSKVRPGRTGDKPGVDYDPKSGDERKFVSKHDTEEHDDRVGNGPDVYAGGKTKKSLDDPKNAKLRSKEDQYEETQQVDELAGKGSLDGIESHYGHKADPSKGDKDHNYQKSFRAWSLKQPRSKTAAGRVAQDGARKNNRIKSKVSEQVDEAVKPKKEEGPGTHYATVAYSSGKNTIHGPFKSMTAKEVKNLVKGRADKERTMHSIVTQQVESLTEDIERNPHVEYHVTNRESGAVKGKYSSIKKARSGLDKHDNAHGSYAHSIKYYHKEKKAYVKNDAPDVSESTELKEHVAQPDASVSRHHSCLTECGWNMVGKIAHGEGADHVYKRMHKTSSGDVTHKVVVRSPDRTWTHYSGQYGSHRASGFEGKGSGSLKQMIGVLARHPMETEETGGIDNTMQSPPASLPPTSSYPGGFGYDNNSPAVI